MIELLAVLLLHAAEEPAAVVLLSRKEGLSSAEARPLAAQVHAALAEGGLRLGPPPLEAGAYLESLGAGDPASCAGDTGCLATLGRLLRAAVVVGVQAGKLGASLALHLEAVRVADGQVVASFTRVFGAKEVPLDPSLFQSFAEQVRKALPRPAPEPRAEPSAPAGVAPPAPAARPPVAEPPQTRAEAPPARGGRWRWSYLAWAAGGAAAGAGGYLFHAASTRTAPLRDPERARALPLETAVRYRNEAQSLQTTGTYLLGGAGLLLLSGAALHLALPSHEATVGLSWSGDQAAVQLTASWP